MAEGKKSSMTKEKVAALDSIGFFWAAKNATASTVSYGDGAGASANNASPLGGIGSDGSENNS